MTEKQTIKELVSAYLASASAMVALSEHGRSHERSATQNTELVTVLSQLDFVCERLRAVLRRELPDTPEDEWPELIAG